MTPFCLLNGLEDNTLLKTRPLSLYFIFFFAWAPRKKKISVMTWQKSTWEGEREWKRKRGGKEGWWKTGGVLVAIATPPIYGKRGYRIAKVRLCWEGGIGWKWREKGTTNDERKAGSWRFDLHFFFCGRIPTWRGILTAGSSRAQDSLSSWGWEEHGQRGSQEGSTAATQAARWSISQQQRDPATHLWQSQSAGVVMN